MLTTITDSQKSIFMECLVWMTLYTIFSTIMHRIARVFFRQCVFWKEAKKRAGIMCGNGQDDSIYLFILAIHHGAAGVLMAMGTIYQDPILWRHGLLLEAGKEVEDLFAMPLKVYPFNVGGTKPEMRVVTVFHHLPGIALFYFILESGLHYNPHMRAIGMWLLLGAAFSCLVGLYQYTLSYDLQMKRVAFLYCTNVAFYTYCRFVAFPKEALLLVQDFKSNPEYDTVMLYCLHAGLWFLTIFNVAIVVNVIPKMIRYIQRAIDGVTEIETEPVPRSRDSIIGYRRVSFVLETTIMT